MKQYRGHYIDHIIFNTAEEIDVHIKKQHLARQKMLYEHMFGDYARTRA